MNIFRTAILLVIAAFLLWTAVHRMRRMQLKERHAIVLMLTAVPFLVLAVWPDLIGEMSDMMGIHYSTVLLLGMGVFFMLVVFELLSIVSGLERKVSTLAQMVSILNEREGLVPRRDPTTTSKSIEEIQTSDSAPSTPEESDDEANTSNR